MMKSVVSNAQNLASNYGQKEAVEMDINIEQNVTIKE